MTVKTHLFQFPILTPSSSPPPLRSNRTPLLTAATRLGALCILLDGLGGLLHALLELCVQLGSQLLVLGVKGPDAVDEDPVVPGVLPALVVNFVAVALGGLLGGLYVHDLGFVEHVHVEAEDFFILAELGGRLLSGWSHCDQKLPEGKIRLVRGTEFGWRGCVD